MMKKFWLHFKIAIITSLDGFIEISINFANQVGSQKTAPSWESIQNIAVSMRAVSMRDNQGTEDSVEVLALLALKQIIMLVTDC